MKRKVIVTCAVTGASALTSNSRYVPITPKQIADEIVNAAKAGAAIAHVHVRDPQTGAPSSDLDLYEETVDRVRSSAIDIVLNLTGGPGAGYDPPVEDGGEIVCVVSPAKRTQHIVQLRPEVCTLDVATMNFGSRAIVNTPTHLKFMAARMVAAGVKPELEVFDLGHLRLALQLQKEGHLPTPSLFQFCLGIPGGAPANTEAMLLMRSMVEAGTTWSAFGISRAQFPMAAQSIILGGHVRVGLEDNLFLSEGELSPGNAPLVERACAIVDSLGCSVATPKEARELLSLTAR
ncbi:3-keto-5-aminohexanoate cleavage protein [Bradyrhizobium sp. 31Argb]|uniref:3-keto-5-aminohexanoate cleavage protein n=1 Tax=unclassified Bradyrhizobium TaxID=2631580 RepID=UPI00102E9A07|nr:3-keto-5-aminohexanoate cleavage protein [Bradyrhizobium sp. Leo170]TAI62048.1 NADPH:quinone reductase [Bradyrhizobium sp. Leo170]